MQAEGMKQLEIIDGYILWSLRCTIGKPPAFFPKHHAFKIQSAGSQSVIPSKLFVSSKVMADSSQYFPKFATLHNCKSTRIENLEPV